MVLWLVAASSPHFLYIALRGVLLPAMVSITSRSVHSRRKPDAVMLPSGKKSVAAS
jgi:hypothetical protein